MSSASPNSEVVLLTGAGASVKFGIPAMKDMMRMYCEDTARGKRATRALDYLHSMGAVKDVEDTLLAIERAIEFPRTATYKLVRQIIARKSAGSPARFAPDFGKLRKDMQVLRGHLLGWIATTCFRFDRVEAERMWGELCKVLADKGYPIFTTNYDFAVEQVAQRSGVPVVDNFKVRQNRWFWDESLSSFSNVGLRVVKLHGSVNWYMAEGEKTIEKLQADAPKSNLEGIPLERVVIFPTRFKDIYETHYFALYMRFLETLRGAKVLIVIGHSLRDEYIRAAIRESFRNPEFHLVVVSPSFPTWPDLPKPSGKGPSQTTHVRFKFEEFSLALAGILQDVASSEVPKKCAEIVHFQRYRKKGKISFDQAPRSISQGESFERVVSIDALALPRAEVVASVQEPGKPKGEGVKLPVVEETSGTPLTIRGLEKIEAKVSIQVPKELAAGKTKMILALKQEDGAIIAKKEYTSHIKQ